MELMLQIHALTVDQIFLSAMVIVNGLVKNVFLRTILLVKKFVNCIQRVNKKMPPLTKTPTFSFLFTLRNSDRFSKT